MAQPQLEAATSQLQQPPQEAGKKRALEEDGAAATSAPKYEGAGREHGWAGGLKGGHSWEWGRVCYYDK